MKKDYISPEMSIKEILPINMLATSGEYVPITPGQGGSAGANDHRGDWDNLW